MSDFGKKIKMALINNGKRQNWLIDEVRKATGLYFDCPYLCKIISGKSSNPTITAAIEKILNITKED